MLIDIFGTAKPGTATLNHLCRVSLYLGATTLADICDDSEEKILSWALTGYARCWPESPWPNQTKPSKYSWQIWRRFLRRFFVSRIPSNSRLDTDWPLDKDLGLWTVSRSLILRDAYFDKESGALYVRSTNGRFTWHNRIEGYMSTYSPMTHHLPAPPPTATFTPIRRFRDQVICTGLIDSFLLSHQPIEVD
eukprot:14630426-Ditylum_brightwellii.AAC.1